MGVLDWWAGGGPVMGVHVKWSTWRRVVLVAWRIAALRPNRRGKSLPPNLWLMYGIHNVSLHYYWVNKLVPSSFGTARLEGHPSSQNFTPQVTGKWSAVPLRIHGWYTCTLVLCIYGIVVHLSVYSILQSCMVVEGCMIFSYGSSHDAWRCLVSCVWAAV